MLAQGAFGYLDKKIFGTGCTRDSDTEALGKFWSQSLAFSYNSCRSDTTNTKRSMSRKNTTNTKQSKGTYSITW